MSASYAEVRPGTAWAERAGATVAALATVQQCYLCTIISAPYFRKHGTLPGIVAFTDGVTAAVVGAIPGACVVLGPGTLFETGRTLDIPTLVILLVTMPLPAAVEEKS